MSVSHHDSVPAVQGTPREPRCGFSKRVAGALAELQVPYGSFDILQDEDIRQGLKARPLCACALHTAPRHRCAGREGRCVGLQRPWPCQGPRCRSAGAALLSAQPVQSPDVLPASWRGCCRCHQAGRGCPRRLAPRVQEYSSWPTFPQLYVKGELLGGCDIVMEMHEAGELQGAIQDALA